MKVILEVDDADSLTGGDRSVLEAIMRESCFSLGLFLSHLDPDGHTWVVFVQEVEA